MTKVNNTILHNGVQVAKGKLICGDVGSFGKMMEMDELRGKLRPIIISEIEKSEIGDKVLLFDDKNIYEITDKKGNLSGTGYCDLLFAKKHCHKILALPENLSDDIIKNISNGVLKSGDDVLVECEKIEWSMNIDPTTVGQTQIKFDSKNHIAIHWAEKENWEKILLRNGYTGHDIIKITNELISYHESIKKKESWESCFARYISAVDSLGYRGTQLDWFKENYNLPIKKDK